MKKTLLFIIISSVVFFINGTDPSYNKNKALNECKLKMKPYTFDFSEITDIKYSLVEQTEEFVVPLFYDESYRLVFNQRGCPLPVGIEIYDKKPNNKNRELLFSYTEKNTSELIVYEPKKQAKLYLYYKIPYTEIKDTKGFIVLAIGFKP